MVLHDEWKKLTELKLETARRMMVSEEWVLAAEYMGYSLECALKSTCCKTLKIPSYPPIKPSNEREMGFFRTHEFDSLLIFSGLNDILGPSSLSWSNFTSHYIGDWPQLMRYSITIDKKFTEELVKELYDLLYDKDDSILKTIFRNERW